MSELTNEETEEFDSRVRGVTEAAKAFPGPTGFAMDHQSYVLALIATAYLRACQDAGWTVEKAFGTLAACVELPDDQPQKGRLS